MNSKIAFCCAGNRNIITPAIVALMSFERYFPHADFFFMGDENTLACKDQLQTFNITHILTSYHHAFNHGRHWPREMFLSLGGPSILHELQYNYTIMIDPDVFCKNNFNLEQILPANEIVSALDDGIGRHVNFKRLKMISKKYNINESTFQLPATNTGFIIWNNDFTSKTKLADEAIQYHHELQTGIFPAIKEGDQALFAFLFSLNPDWKIKFFDDRYNFRLGNKYVRQRDLNQEQLLILHFTSLKPWIQNKRKHLTTNDSFFDEWRLFKKELMI